MDFTLDLLPHDVLLLIFEFLDEKDLMALCKASRVFHDLITSSACLMRNSFPILIRHCETIEVPFEGANYQAVKVSYNACLYRPVADKLRDYARTLKSLSMWKILENDLKHYAALLAFLPNLRELTIAECRARSSKFAEPPPQLPALRKVAFINSERKLLKLLAACTQVTSLRLELLHREPQNSDYCGEFLARNGSLAHLSLFGTARSVVNSPSRFRFRLASLEVDHLYFHSPVERANALRFLAAHCRRLERLKLCNAPRGDFLAFVLGDLPRLRRLEMGIGLLERGVDFVDLPARNSSLETLAVSGETCAPETLKKVLEHFVGLRSLEIRDQPTKRSHAEDISDLLVTISAHLPRLERLTLPYMPGLVSPVVELKALKSLAVSYFRKRGDAFNLALLVAYCPGIERLSINCVGNPQMSNCDLSLILRRARNLRELCLGKFFEFDDQALNIVKTCLKRLKRFTIFTGNGELMRSMAERIHKDGLNCVIHEWRVAERFVAETAAADAFNTVRSYEEYLSRLVRREGTRGGGDGRQALRVGGLRRV